MKTIEPFVLREEREQPHTKKHTKKTLKCMEQSYLYFWKYFCVLVHCTEKGIDEYVDATSLLSCFFAGWPLLPDS